MPPGLAWITGSGGLIGSYLCRNVPRGWKVRKIGSAELANERAGELQRQFDEERPALVIHCAAISKNPACDADPDLAKRVNTDLTHRLSVMSRDISFVFMSTDLVFDGLKGNYTEEDAPRPLGVYPRTKVAAEEAVLKNPRHTIIRTSLNAGHSPTGDRAFNEEMRKAFAAGKTLNCFVDEFRCPIPAEATARAIWEIAGTPGIFHLCGRERLSRFEIAQLVAGNRPELNPKIVAGTLRDYKGSPRSPDTSMNCGKIAARLSFQLPKFSAWVEAQPAGSL